MTIEEAVVPTGDLCAADKVIGESRRGRAWGFDSAPKNSWDGMPACYSCVRGGLPSLRASRPRRPERGISAKGAIVFWGFPSREGLHSRWKGRRVLCLWYASFITIHSLFTAIFLPHSPRGPCLPPQVSRPQYSTGSFETWFTARSERMSSISQTSTRRSSAPPTSR